MFRLKYRHGGKEKRLSLGIYPSVTLAEARKRRNAARDLLAKGIDPSQDRQATRAANAVSAENTFRAVADEWVQARSGEWVEGYTRKIRGWLKQHVNPIIGSVPIGDLRAPAIMAMLRKIVARGTLDTAGRVRETVSAIFRFAIATGRADHDYAADLRDALPKATKRNFASLTEPDDVAGLLRAIDGYQGSAITLAALRLSPLVFQRPGELRGAQWSEFDLDAALWRIPPVRQKLKKAKKQDPRTPPHVVPLSTQGRRRPDGNVDASLLRCRRLGVPRHVPCGRFAEDRRADRPGQGKQQPLAVRTAGCALSL